MAMIGYSSGTVPSQPSRVKGVSVFNNVMRYMNTRTVGIGLAVLTHSVSDSTEFKSN